MTGEQRVSDVTPDSQSVEPTSNPGSDWSPESGRRAAADRVVAAIERAVARAGVDGEQTRDWRWDDPVHRSLLRSWFEDAADVDDGEDVGESVLPGFGPGREGGNAREDCGEIHPFVCDSCGHVVEFGRTCGMSVCGRCSAVWARNRAIQKAAKVRRVRKEKHQHTPDAEHQKLHHLVLSPRPDWFAALAEAGVSLPDALEAAREAVKDVLDELRAQGVLIRHSFRGEREDGSLASEGDDRGKWPKRLFNGLPWDDVRNDLAWKPHFHAVVVSDWIAGGDLTDYVEQETGWVIHRITGEDSSVSIPDDGAMARVLTYALSHADIEHRDDRPNRSAVWEVGSFDASPIKSDGRFTPRPHDLTWADSVVKEAAKKTLGLASGTTDCGASIPPVDDPDELARRILESLFPDDDGRQEVSTDAVLAHVEQGNIDVDVTTSSGGGGKVVVRDAFGEPVGAGGWCGEIPAGPAPRVRGAGSLDEHRYDEHADDSHEDNGEDCTGTLVPLGVARSRGLLDDLEWCQNAAHVDEAREADREWPDDLDPWRTSAPDGSNLVG
jgi:hypothetical protein